MDSVASILPKVLKKRGVYEHASASLVCAHARQWIERHLPLHVDDIRVQALKNGKLIVAAADSSSLLVLKRREQDLLASLHGALPDAGPLRLLVRRL